MSYYNDEELTVKNRVKGAFFVLGSAIYYTLIMFVLGGWIILPGIAGWILLVRTLFIRKEKLQKEVILNDNA